MAGKLKVVGVFRENDCILSVDGSYIAWINDLEYTGIGTESDNMRLYKNKTTKVWLDYAVYE